MKLILIFATIISITKAYPPITDTYGSEGYHTQGSLQPQGFSHGHMDPATEARRLADKYAHITNFQSENSGHQYKHAYETSNGISAHETGTVSDGSQVHGGYSYTGDDGQQYAVAYTADKNGFRPSGNHLPTPEPLSAEIAKSLEQNAAEEARGIYDDGSYRHDQHLQHPHESPLTQYPHENHVTQYPYQSYVAQYPHESHVTQHPVESQETFYPHDDYVSQHPHENHQYGAHEAFKIDVHPQ